LTPAELELRAKALKKAGKVFQEVAMRRRERSAAAARRVYSQRGFAAGPPPPPVHAAPQGAPPHPPGAPSPPPAPHAPGAAGPRAAPPPSAAPFESMSVHELRQHLAARGASLTGAIERADLVEIARALG
jgi:hypothetical protein